MTSAADLLRVQLRVQRRLFGVAVRAGGHFLAELRDADRLRERRRQQRPRRSRRTVPVRCGAPARRRALCRLASAPTSSTDSLPFGPIAFALASSSGAATRTPGDRAHLARAGSRASPAGRARAAAASRCRRSRGRAAPPSSTGSGSRPARRTAAPPRPRSRRPRSTPARSRARRRTRYRCRTLPGLIVLDDVTARRASPSGS